MRFNPCVGITSYTGLRILGEIGYGSACRTFRFWIYMSPTHHPTPSTTGVGTPQVRKSSSFRESLNTWWPVSRAHLGLQAQASTVIFNYHWVGPAIVRPRGLMVKALVFGTKDWRFESSHGREIHLLLLLLMVGWLVVLVSYSPPISDEVRVCWNERPNDIS